MLIWVLRILVLLSGPIIGYTQIDRGPKGILFGVAIALTIIVVEIIIEKVPLDKIIVGGLGGVLGLIAAKLVDYTVASLFLDDSNVTNPNKIVEFVNYLRSYSILIKIAFAYVGVVIGVRKWDELGSLDKQIHLTSKRQQVDLKILDSSAIIDGRVVDLCETKFLSGNIVVPNFVILELQRLADSEDSTKRSRGRRGLDLLQRLQQKSSIPVKIYDKDYPETSEVDQKLMKMAEELKSSIITTDFNLNKAASLHGVTVLNVNELAGVLKPPVLPGENLSVFIVKDGKERKQGVAYLDDGTMVVVENGRPHIGKKAEVTVTNILQTSAGRMVFTNMRGETGTPE